jgi:hypothetical protein
MTTPQLDVGKKLFVTQYPCRKSCTSISHNIPVWQRGETLRQFGAGIAVRGTRP